MRQSRVHRFLKVLRPVAVGAVWMISLAGQATAQQGLPNDAKSNREVATPAPQAPARTGAPEPSGPPSPVAKGGTGTVQQPAKQLEERREPGGKETGGKETGGKETGEKGEQASSSQVYSPLAVLIAGLLIAVLGFLFWLQLG